MVLSSETPARIAEALVPFSNLAANGEIPILVRSEWYVLESIPIVVPARWIAEISVVFVLAEQCVGLRIAGTWRLSKDTTGNRPEDAHTCTGKTDHLECPQRSRRN